MNSGSAYILGLLDLFLLTASQLLACSKHVEVFLSGVDHYDLSPWDSSASRDASKVTIIQSGAVAQYVSTE